MACNSSKFLGRDVVLEYAIGCGDQLPQPGDWKLVGSMRTKSFSANWNTADVTDDTVIGNLNESLATNLEFQISGDGILRRSGPGYENQRELQRHAIQPAATGGQPVAWFRMTYPDLTFTAFMIFSTISREGAYNEGATFSFEATATASDFGLIVDDTPDPDAPTPTSVSAYPEAVMLAPSATQRLVAAVEPATASQNLIWSSSAPEVAAVTQAGVVTAIADGTATITVRSSVVSSVTDTVAVTVE